MVYTHLGVLVDHVCWLYSFSAYVERVSSNNGKPRSRTMMQAENTAGTSVLKLLSRKLAIWKRETAYLHLVQEENGRKLIESADVLVVDFE